MRRDYEGYMDGIGAALFVVIFVYMCIGIVKLIEYIYDNRETIAENIMYYATKCVELCKKLYGYLQELISQVEIGDC